MVKREQEIEPVDDLLIDANEAARQLKLPERTVREMAKEGTLPSIRLKPRILRFSPEALRDFIRERHATATE